MEYDERLAREYLIYPNIDEKMSFVDIKRRRNLELFAMEHDKKVLKLANKLIKDNKIWSGTKEQIQENIKLLHK